jgi:hypothetical protein
MVIGVLRGCCVSLSVCFCEVGVQGQWANKGVSPTSKSVQVDKAKRSRWQDSQSGKETTGKKWLESVDLAVGSSSSE